MHPSTGMAAKWLFLGHVHGRHTGNDHGIKGLLWPGGRPTDASSTLRATLQRSSATQVRGSRLQCDIGHGQRHFKIRDRLQRINGFRNVKCVGGPTCFTL